MPFAPFRKIKIPKPTFINPMFILYDIETLPLDFTVATYIAKDKRVIVYSDTKTPMPENEIREKVLERFKGLVTRIDFVSGYDHYDRLRKWLLFGQDQDGLTRAGWNSKKFDLPVMFANFSGSAPDARFIADQLITGKRRAYQLTLSNNEPIGRSYQLLKSISVDMHHLDISILNEKSNDVDGKVRTPASLKLISGYAGLEVLDDEVTRIDFDKWQNSTWSFLAESRRELLTVHGELTPLGFKQATNVDKADFTPEIWANLDDRTRQCITEQGDITDFGLQSIAGVSRADWRLGTWYELDENMQALVNPDASLTKRGLIELVTYNIQDVLNSGFIFELPEYKTSYHTKKSLIEKFNLNANGNVANPSDTSAQLSSLTLTGGDRNLFTDKQGIDFRFPMPDGTEIDLLDYLHERKIIPPVLHDFYGLLRGRDALSREEMREFMREADELLSLDSYSVDGSKVIPSVPYNKSKVDALGIEEESKATRTNATISVPYFDANLKAIRSYNTFSRGGSHGSTSTNAVNFTFDNARMVKLVHKPKSDKNPEAYTKYDNDIQKKTVDMSAWAIDVASFYPSFLVLLKTYMLADGTDVYDQIRVDRLKIKASLPKNKRDYTEEDRIKDREQAGAKLILNSVSGASNLMSDFALLKLDNAIMSMRLMGNLFIYMIATHFVRELGAEVLSTNTDGIEISFDHLGEGNEPSPEQIEALSLLLTHEYGFELEPEKLDRFVVKDSNNRIEWHGNVINKSSGKINKGFNPSYAKTDDNGNPAPEPNRIGLDSKLDHPMVTDLAVLAYIDEHPDYLNPENKFLIPKPATKTRPAIGESEDVLQWLSDWIENYAKGNYRGLDFNIVDWLVFTKGTRSRMFYADGVKLQDNNRYVFSNQGQTITSTLLNKDSGIDKPTKITGWTTDRAVILNTIDSLNAFDPAIIDYEAYARWAYNTLLVWVNPEQTKSSRQTKTAQKSNTSPRRKRATANATSSVETPSDATGAPVENSSQTDHVEDLVLKENQQQVVKDVLEHVSATDTNSILARYMSSVGK